VAGHWKMKTRADCNVLKKTWMTSAYPVWSYSYFRPLAYSETSDAPVQSSAEAR